MGSDVVKVPTYASRVRAAPSFPARPAVSDGRAGLAAAYLANVYCINRFAASTVANSRLRSSGEPATFLVAIAESPILGCYSASKDTASATPARSNRTRPHGCQ